MAYLKTLVWSAVTVKCSSSKHCEMFSGLDGANDHWKKFHPCEMHRDFL